MSDTVSDLDSRYIEIKKQLEWGQTFPVGQLVFVTVILKYHPKITKPGVFGVLLILWVQGDPNPSVERCWNGFVQRLGSGTLLPIPYYRSRTNRVRLPTGERYSDAIESSTEAVLAHFCKPENLKEALESREGIVSGCLAADINERLRKIVEYVRIGVSLNPTLIDAALTKQASRWS